MHPDIPPADTQIAKELWATASQSATGDLFAGRKGSRPLRASECPGGGLLLLMGWPTEARREGSPTLGKTARGGRRSRWRMQ